MKLLAIETSSIACSVALLSDNKLDEIFEIAPMQQAQKILPMVDAILKRNNIIINQLDALVFGSGPGSFTGIRIATSVVQGIGFSLNLPIIPVSSLAGMAQKAYQEHGWQNILVAIDARINEVYYGAYKLNKSGIVEIFNREQVVAPKDVLSLSGTWFGVGNAWEVYKDQIKCKIKELDVKQLPRASSLITIAQHRYEKTEWIKAEDALPIYLRDNIAKKS